MGNDPGTKTVTAASAPVRGAAREGLALVWVFPLPDKAGISLDRAEGRAELVLGRDSACDVVLDGNEVSRRHAALRWTESGVALHDLDSRNGIRLDGRGVAQGLLAAGGVVRVGGWIGVVTAKPGAVAEIAPGLYGGATLAQAVAPLRQAAPSDLPIVLEGETGTGKEVVARAIHAWSGRRGPFLAVNCAALPEALAESELFGYRKGAFTGADKASPGALPRRRRRARCCSTRSSDLPLALQAKLLRVLEQREVQPLGETRPVPIDVRIIVAGQQSLLRRVAGRPFSRRSAGAAGRDDRAAAAPASQAGGRRAALLAAAAQPGRRSARAGGRRRSGRAPLSVRLAVQRARAGAAGAPPAGVARGREDAARRAPA